jgi:RNA recognition motif-containing protein
MISYKGRQFDLDWFPKLDINISGKIDIMIPSPKVEGINIYFDASEPEAMRKVLYGIEDTVISKYLNQYDIIITNSELYRNQYPDKTISFPFGELWVRDSSTEKEDSISFMTSGKLMTDGQYLRHQIYHSFDELSYKKRFFESRIPIKEKYPKLPNDDKKYLFNSAFSIVVENHSQKYYFSEKLIDCIWSKSLPIYYGCKNIEEYFDTRGMIIFNDFDELKEIVNNLSYDDYTSRLTFMEENFNRCHQYYGIKKRLENVINEKLELLNLHTNL